MRKQIVTFKALALFVVRAGVAMALLSPVSSHSVLAQSLKGSHATMVKQNRAAIRYGYSFLETSQAVSNFVESGYLVKVTPTRFMDLNNVSYPYARPAVKVFLERLSSQYISACGEKMTVTSLTRPLNKQPVNASDSSVHPTGMAVDLRIPAKSKCRSWLESTLLSLEASDVIDVTRERNPPHYHVAVFTETYEQYVANLGKSTQEYTVRSGDTLSKIASATGSSIVTLRSANGLKGDLIRVGQKLEIPVTPVVADNTASSKKTTPAVAANTAIQTVPNQQIAAVSAVTHRVRRGDTLWRIATKYGTSVNNIRAENGLSNDLLQVGQELRLSLNASSR